MKAKNKRKTPEIVLRRGKPAAVMLDISVKRRLAKRNSEIPHFS